MRIQDKYIDISEIQRYFNLLLKPYTKNGVEKRPFYQFAEGGGQELGSKFWNKKSSSRLAFDLYSWMEFDDSIKDVEFEYHLPGLQSDGYGPNMDVFIETDRNVFFVESKFTENVINWRNMDSISTAYYIDSYFNERKHVVQGFAERYYGLEKVGKQVSKFIKQLKDSIRDKDAFNEHCEWFDVKQEICHVVGILFFLLKDNGKNAKLYQNKDGVYLYNILWKFNDDNIENNEYLMAFKASLKELIDGLSPVYPILNKFKFGVLTIQDVINGAMTTIDSSIMFPKDMDKRLAYYNKLVNEHQCLRSNFNKKS